MPRGQKPEGEHPLSNAERQARYRARHLKPPPPVVRRTRRAMEIVYDESSLAKFVAEALEAIADLDLSALAETKPPRGYGRD